MRYYLFIIVGYKISVIRYKIDIYVGYPTLIMECCKPKGYLTYLILWILHKKSMKGSEISKELEKRRGSRPSSGTLYPPLNELKNKELIKVDENKYYSLTPKGENEVKEACKYICNIFYDIEDMLKFCK